MYLLSTPITPEVTVSGASKATHSVVFVCCYISAELHSSSASVCSYLSVFYYCSIGARRNTWCVLSVFPISHIADLESVVKVLYFTRLTENVIGQY